VTDPTEDGTADATAEPASDATTDSASDPATDSVSDDATGSGTPNVDDDLEDAAGVPGTDARYGDAWVYESIVGALPGVDVGSPAAIGIQVLAFEVGVVLVAALYGLWQGVIVGTAAVAVAAVGSALMLSYARRIRRLDAPEAYRRLLFGSNVEVVLGVLAFVATVTHLFVYDPRVAAEPLVETLLGEEPPVLATYLTLLVLWDVVYRIGTSWWASVAAVWRAIVYDFDPARSRAFARADGLNLAFAAVQLLFVPFVLDRPVLLVVLLGHVLAVGAATALSVGLTLAGSGDAVGN
jgi:hypothetical protein